MMKAIGLDDAGLFRHYLAVQDSVSCEMSFANLFLWGLTSRNRFEESNTVLVVENQEDKCFFFPSGPFLPPEQLAEIGSCFYDVPDAYLERFPAAAELFSVEYTEDNDDYIYELDHLIALAGPRLRKKRAQIREFESAHPDAELGEITPDVLPEFSDFAARMFGHVEWTDSLQKEIDMWPGVLENLFRPELGLKTMTLRAGGKLIGFAICSELGQKCWDVHFEKVDPQFRGAPQFFVWKLAEKLSALGGRLMNREQDLGIPGLRHAKRSLDPAFMFRRSMLTRR
ncbi:MAG: phosphatidylglycerol lysyltransferase domain-containing protein [Victivallaceae bacterium]|nr:phosphatidylglycerol lysyltransferase domain-containing protein [Victivallaceae bacterium]